jgi:hypothetical protein
MRLPLLSPPLGCWALPPLRSALWVASRWGVGTGEVHGASAAGQPGGSGQLSCQRTRAGAAKPMGGRHRGPRAGPRGGGAAHPPCAAAPACQPPAAPPLGPGRPWQSTPDGSRRWVTAGRRAGEGGLHLIGGGRWSGPPPREPPCLGTPVPRLGWVWVVAPMQRPMLALRRQADRPRPGQYLDEPTNVRRALACARRRRCLAVMAWPRRRRRCLPARPSDRCPHPIPPPRSHGPRLAARRRGVDMAVGRTPWAPPRSAPLSARRRALVAAAQPSLLARLRCC